MGKEDLLEMIRFGADTHVRCGDALQDDDFDIDKVGVSRSVCLYVYTCVCVCSDTYV